MIENVGTCFHCKKNIYCLDGFFNGMKQEDGNIICFDCYERD
ncbi:hypothetical protein [Bacillus sp. FJAT-45350]|nr:hypothetical protein [Bacillus sp. FJAT-45350]